jgi:PAS domain-containing protein
MKNYQANTRGENPNPVVKEILDGIEIGVVLLNPEGKIIFANRASEEIFSWANAYSAFFPREQRSSGCERGTDKSFFIKKRVGCL